MSPNRLNHVPGYKPSDSGQLQGGGTRRSRQHRLHKLKHFNDVRLADFISIREEVPDFDPALEFEYTQRELLLLAEKILDSDERPYHEEPRILGMAKMRDQAKREIFVASGTPEPAFVKGLYWRTHPNGRKVVENHTAKGSSYYT